MNKNTRHTLLWILPLVIVVAALILASCQKQKEEESDLGPHPQGWLDPDNANFHGRVALQDSANTCRSCHGANLHGGTGLAESCYNCHSVLHTEVSNENIDSHRAFVASTGWDLERCRECHGADYSGGWALQQSGDSGTVCIRCHAPTDTVMMLTGCNVCHTTEPELRTFWKTPYGTESPGQHETHVAERGYSCRECHPSLSASGHPHPLPADVAFVATRALFADTFRVDDGDPTFQHLGASNSGNGACSNIYCHSDGKGPQHNPGPPVAFPEWTSGGITCGSCHRTPPANPEHPQGVSNCSVCHSDVDPASNFAYPDSIRFLPDSIQYGKTHVDANLHL